MGYDVAILKTAKGRRLPVLDNETEQLLAQVPGWEYDKLGQTLLRTAEEERGFWLDVSRTELTAKEPTEPQIALMLELAARLGARVRGDELETYRSPTETYHHPDDERLLASTRPLGAAPSTRSEKLIRYIKIGALLLLALNFVAYVVYGFTSAA
jgi:hypothetical protein